MCEEVMVEFEAEAENEMAGKSFTAFTLCLSGQTISRYISQRKFMSGFNIESVEIKPGVKAKAPEGSYERYENNPNGISKVLPYLIENSKK